MNNMIFSLRLIFIGWAILAALLPLQLFFALWSGIFFGVLIEWLQIFPDRCWFAFIVPAAVAFFTIAILGYVGKKLNYSRTECRVFSDRLEFEEGFFATSRKTLRFLDVKEVTLHKGILQRICRLGTIYLATIATGTLGTVNRFPWLGLVNASASGLALRDILNSDAAFERIGELIYSSDRNRIKTS